MATKRRQAVGISREALSVRGAALEALLEARVPFLVTGAYAFFEYTGIFRETKDLDVALCRRDLDIALEALSKKGFRTEILNPVWLAKAYAGEHFIDLIFSSGNGIAVVDELWFHHARDANIAGYPCKISPPEEMIWSKAFVSERERYDGADVNHLIYACGEAMDWRRLLARFEPHWEVLFSHLVLYRFTYPSERSRVPEWLIQELCRRTMADLAVGDAPGHVCRGRLISNVQYRYDYEHDGFISEDVVEPAPTVDHPLPRQRVSRLG